MKGVSTSVIEQVDVPREQFFYWFLSVSLDKIMHSYTILPGVSSVRNQTGPMHQAGASREIVFTDGSTAVEKILSSDPPAVINYTVYNLTSIFRFLVRDGEAQIIFRELSPDETAVDWRYTYFGHNWLAELILRILIPLFWRGFMRATLSRAKLLAEVELSSQTTSVAA